MSCEYLCASSLLVFFVIVLAFYWFYNGQLSCIDPDLSIGVILTVGSISLSSAMLSYLHSRRGAKDRKTDAPDVVLL
jgi:hypothetical protein